MDRAPDFESVDVSSILARGAFLMKTLPEEKLIQLILERLERISADSYWAHRASGVRGALLRSLEEQQGQQNPKALIELALQLLAAAAREKGG